MFHEIYITRLLAWPPILIHHRPPSKCWSAQSLINISCLNSEAYYAAGKRGTGRLFPCALELVMTMDQSLTTDMSFGEAHITTLDEAGRHSYRGRGRTEKDNEFGFVPPVYGARRGRRSEHIFPIGRRYGDGYPYKGSSSVVGNDVVVVTVAEVGVGVAELELVPWQS